MKLVNVEAENFWQELLEKNIAKRERREREVKVLAQKIKKGQFTFKHSLYDWEGIIHPCTDNKYKWQFTYFDELGPIGDVRRNSLEEMAKDIYDYNFETCYPNEFKILS